jgi:hypothetical protein
MALGTIIGAIYSQIWAIAQVVPGLASYRLEKQKTEHEAAAAMRKALNRTTIFLKTPNFDDTEKLTEISDLWNDASEKVGIVDRHLGQILGEKSRFWSNPELFITLGRDKDILSLNEVTSKIERLYIKMR